MYLITEFMLENFIKAHLQKVIAKIKGIGNLQGNKFSDYDSQ